MLKLRGTGPNGMGQFLALGLESLEARGAAGAGEASAAASVSGRAASSAGRADTADAGVEAGVERRNCEEVVGRVNSAQDAWFVGASLTVVQAFLCGFHLLAHELGFALGLGEGLDHGFGMVLQEH